MAIDSVLLVRFVLLAVALALAFLAREVWRRRHLAAEARAIAVLLLAVSVYAFGYAGEVAQSHLYAAQRWLDVEYLGTPWIPGLWLLAVYKRWGLRPRKLLFFAIPIITFVGHVTDPWLHFYNDSASLVYRSPFWVVETDRGAIAWLNIAYLSVALVWGAWIGASRLWASQALFRKQAWLLIVGGLCPLAGYLVYLVGWSPYGLDLGPLSLTVSALVAAVNIFALKCFDLTPLAREHVFNCMRDAVLVLDTQKRLIDFNPAARGLIPSLGDNRLGEDISTVLGTRVSLEAVFAGERRPQRIELDTGEGTHYFELRAFALKSRVRQLGWAAILANVTAQVRLVRKLRHYAETDPLTNISNRRRFFAALEQECTRFLRYHSQFSVFIIDLDHFKRINDRYGHLAGDQVLRAASERIAECLRGADLLSRYGGEEFAVLLPVTSQEGAFAVAERVRQKLRELPVEYDGASIPVSASIGVASCDNDAAADSELLLRNADRALYAAKSAGRNRVEVWTATLDAEQPAPAD